MSNLRTMGGTREMKLAKYIANLGYGSRREVERMIAAERITRGDGTPLNEGDSAGHDDIRVDGELLDPPPGCVLMLHKPVGYVCSTTDINPVIYALLPERFRLRSPIIAPIGRLDLDTSGLLLLTDDGKINHRITSPRAHLPKTYVAALAQELNGSEAEIFASGTMLLNGEETALAPAQLEVIDARTARVTITEGRYHQVKRMFAAVGNHVERLHRSAIGSLELRDLPAGQWRELNADEIAGMLQRRGSAR
jgi:16S rRNA pseudouridine516 synthase